MTDPYGDYDAAYVLGALSPQERREYEEHLAECPACSTSVRELAGMPGLLSRVSAEDAVAEPTEGPPPTLLPNLLARARRERRRSRYWLVGAGLAAAAAVLAVVLVLALGVLSPAAPTEPAAPMAPVAAAPIDASATLVDKAWGTQVDLTCTYHAGSAYAPSSYTLVAVDDGGTQHVVSSWSVVSNKTSTITGATALHRDEIRALEVRTPGGQPVLRLAVHS